MHCTAITLQRKKNILYFFFNENSCVLDGVAQGCAAGSRQKLIYSQFKQSNAITCCITGIPRHLVTILNYFTVPLQQGYVHLHIFNEK